MSTITSHENEDRRIPILCYESLYDTSVTYLVDTLLLITKTVCENNSSVELEATVIDMKHVVYIASFNMGSDNINTKMNIVQLGHILRKWTVYNTEMVPDDQMSDIKELIWKIDNAENINEVLNAITLTTYVLSQRN